MTATGSSETPATPDAPTRLSKHSLVIAGHRTSISLETAFWRELRAIAAASERPLARLVGEIDAARGEANLSSAIRVFVLQHMRAACPDDVEGRSRSG